MEKIDKAIEILQAFKEGKTIEYASVNNFTWQSICDDKELRRKIWNDLDNLRIKPQPTCRPYANAEEFLKDSKEHGPYLNLKTCGSKHLYMPIDIFRWGIEYNDNTRYNWTEVYESFTFQDGHPCGILE